MIVKGATFNVINPALFAHSLEGIRSSIGTPDHFFAADNIITWNRNLSFMTQKDFMGAVQKHATTEVELSIVWRSYIMVYFARLAAKKAGDFVEVGAYKGNTAHILLDCVPELADGTKRYYLYDMFEHTGIEKNHAMPEHGPDLFQKVYQRFAPYPTVHVIKGPVPASFEQGLPEHIAFAHVDLNQAEAEVEALKIILPRMTSGGVLVLDDYGWFGYHAQKEAEDPVLAAFGLAALELPTGQGLVLIP